MSNEKKQYRIAVIPGDGIGKEVVPEGLRVLEAAAKKLGVLGIQADVSKEDEVHGMFERMIAKDPEARFKDADAFLKALDAAEKAPDAPRPQDTAAYAVPQTTASRSGRDNRGQAGQEQDVARDPHQPACDLLILEDNPYGLLGFDGDPIRALRAEWEPKLLRYLAWKRDSKLALVDDPVLDVDGQTVRATRPPEDLVFIEG